MKSVLISIKPKWCELIANGKKTIEVRKTRPKIATPFKCYIYCTKPKMPVRDNGSILMFEDDLAITNRFEQGKRVENPCGAMMEGELFLNGKVIGEFVCDNIDTYDDDTIFTFRYEDYAKWNDFNLDRACIHPEDFQNYANGKWLYGWHISDLVIYDKPKELSGFRKPIICHRGIQKDNCNGCWDCEIKRPPQSWCYTEILN